MADPCYMILVALIKAFQNHIGFAIIRASGKDWQRRYHDNPPRGPPNGLGSGPERVKAE